MTMTVPVDYEGNRRRRPPLRFDWFLIGGAGLVIGYLLDRARKDHLKALGAPALGTDGVILALPEIAVFAVVIAYIVARVRHLRR